MSERLRREGATAIFLAVNGKPAAVLAIADPVKRTTPDALAALAKERVHVVMLPEDNKTTAQAVAQHLGITEVEAEVLPDQKSAVVEKLRRKVASWRWRATASTTRLPLPRLKSASPWEPGPTSPSRAPG